MVLNFRAEAWASLQSVTQRPGSSKRISEHCSKRAAECCSASNPWHAWRFQRSAILGCNLLWGVLSAPTLAGKPLGLKTPSQSFHPEASWDTQDISSAPSSPGEETNAQLDFLCIGLKPDTVSIFCYDSYGSENYFRTEASSDLEAEQSLAPKSKCFPRFPGGVLGGSWDDEMQWKPAALQAGLASFKAWQHKKHPPADGLTHYQHGTSPSYIWAPTWVSSDGSFVTNCPIHL